MVVVNAPVDHSLREQPNNRQTSSSELKPLLQTKVEPATRKESPVTPAVDIQVKLIRFLTCVFVLFSVPGLSGTLPPPCVFMCHCSGGLLLCELLNTTVGSVRLTVEIAFANSRKFSTSNVNFVLSVNSFVPLSFCCVINESNDHHCYVHRCLVQLAYILIGVIVCPVLWCHCFISRLSDSSFGARFTSQRLDQKRCQGRTENTSCSESLSHIQALIIEKSSGPEATSLGNR